MVVSDPNTDRLDHLRNTYGVATLPSNQEAVSTANYVFVNVLPQVVGAVIEELCRTPFPSNKVIISLAAGIPMDRYKCLGKDSPDNKSVTQSAQPNRNGHHSYFI